MKKLLTFSAVLALVTPFIVAAQAPPVSQGNLGNIEALVVGLGRIFNLLIPILIVLAILAFFWGLIAYIRGGKGISTGKNIMIAGIVSLFIMVSLWGIVAFLGNALGINGGGSLPAPTVSNLR